MKLLQIAALFIVLGAGLLAFNNRSIHWFRQGGNKRAEHIANSLMRELQMIFFKDISLRGHNLSRATAQEVIQMEAQLNMLFPYGYKEFVTHLGNGFYCDLLRVFVPSELPNQKMEFQERVKEYYFWDEGHDVLARERVQESVPIIDTDVGHELIMHPRQPDVIYVLPHEDEKIYRIGSNVFEALDWVAESGIVTYPAELKSFESRIDLEKRSQPSPSPAETTGPTYTYRVIYRSPPEDKDYRSLVDALGDPLTLSKLLEKGASPNAQGTDDCTPLMCAATADDVESIKILLAAGAHISARDKKGWTALMDAAFRGRTEAVKVLRQYVSPKREATDRAVWPALLLAASRGHTETVAALLASGDAVDTRDKHGWTALMWAVFNGHRDLVKALLAAGADVNRQNDYGTSALIHAVVTDNVEMARILIAAGAQVNTKNESGWTPLMYAARNAQAPMIKLLLSAGADVYAMDNEGSNALAKAAGQTRSAVWQLLKNASIAK